ncbi:MAG TPA: MarR family transcriptional regulator [Polyangiaceae bacterium]|jgi:DNA-binding MarR family transcriptional regulator|nr:MarR family transcriptional regulator [Polyangiaceae bacterium]
MLDDRESKAELDAIVETIVYLYTESRRLTKAAAREVGLTGPQLTVIKLLDTFGDLSLSSLSERIRAQNSTVTGIIDRMEREGLVTRERSTSDRRVVFIRLSDKGKEMAKAIRVEPMEIFRAVLSTLSKDDTKDLVRILGKLGKRVRAIVKEHEQGNGGS